MKRAMKFIRSESGQGSYMALGTLAFSAVIGGVALDYTSGMREKTRLQIATDAAALAAASEIDDIETARAVALETARRNLGDETIITAADVQFGYIDEETHEFVLSSNQDEVTATRVVAQRDLGRGNELPTMLLDIVGLDEFEFELGSVAGARRGGGGGALAGCEDATFLSENRVNTGGGIELVAAVCIHGEKGIRTGGGDFYSDEVRLSAADVNRVEINSFAPADLPLEQVRIARSLAPVILPELDNMHSNLWEEITPACNWSNDDKEVDGVYAGEALPSFIGEGAPADLVCMNNFRTFQPGEIEENTIYMSRGGIQFAGGIDASNVAMISQGQIGVGGGPALAFNDVFFFGTDVNMAGNIEWGPEAGDCSSDRYSVYVFGLNSLSLGGFAPGTTVNNVVGAAKAFRPGGALSGTGMYFESEQTIQLGGDLDITGCDHSYTSEIELAETGLPDRQEATGSFLVR